MPADVKQPTESTMALHRAAIIIDTHVDTIQRAVDLGHDLVHANPSGFMDLERMKVVYADGDSMEPIIRNKGPMLFFEDPVTDVRKIDPRTVYAINLGGKMVVKCIQRDRDGTLLAKSLNPAHPPFPLKLDNGQDVRIVGRVLWSPYDLRNGVDERLLET